MSAQILIGGTSSVFIPAICAVSLGIVGRPLFDGRQGRNQSFNSAGNVLAAVSMGLLGYFISNRSIFFFVATRHAADPLCPGQHPPQRDRLRARTRGKGRHREPATCRRRRTAKGSAPRHLSCLRGDVSLCQRRDAAPVGRDAGQGSGSQLDDVHVGLRRDHSNDRYDHCVLSGRKAGTWGRKPLLLIAFAVLPIRAVSLYAHRHTAALVAIQVLDGVGVGIFGVVSVLVIADLTQGSGRFNLTLGPSARRLALAPPSARRLPDRSCSSLTSTRVSSSLLPSQQPHSAFSAFSCRRHAINNL